LRSRLALLLVTAVGALSASPIGAEAAQPPGPGKLRVGVEVLRFNTAGRSTSATGLVTANLTDNAGHTTTAKTQISLKAAAAAGGCKVLHLFLNELTLQLLGLTAHLDKVTLDITGDARGGVLGSLFCRLAHARVASARKALAGALTAGVRHGHGHALRFTAVLNPVARASAVPSCPVLDLVVGPLNLQLLGLVVDLQKVHLNVVATPGGGALGDLFCKLSV
jgi:hypothetical protein